MSDRRNLFQQIRHYSPYENDLFYDWFCSDSSLPRRSKALMNKVKQIAFSLKFDGDKAYVFFKNNAPVSGGTYDDFRICDLETGDVLFTITFNCPYEDHPVNVYSPQNDFEAPVQAGTWKDIKNWFLHGAAQQ